MHKGSVSFIGYIKCRKKVSDQIILEGVVGCPLEKHSTGLVTPGTPWRGRSETVESSIPSSPFTGEMHTGEYESIYPPWRLHGGSQTQYTARQIDIGNRVLRRLLHTCLRHVSREPLTPPIQGTGVVSHNHRCEIIGV